MAMKETGDDNYFFSARPEFLVLFGEITSAGFAAEFGYLNSKKLFLTGELSGGARYAGAGLNMGYSSILYDFGYHGIYGSNNPSSELRLTAGVHAGYHHVTIPVNLESESGENLGRIYGRHTATAGLFWKFTCGYVDITNKLLFGYRSNSPWYDETVNDIIKKQSGSLVYTVGIGYTITRIWKWW
jgi:hypothetical protein